MSDEQEKALSDLVERARARGLRPATEWEIENIDPRYQYKSTRGGPVFVHASPQHQPDAQPGEEAE